MVSRSLNQQLVNAGNPSYPVGYPRPAPFPIDAIGTSAWAACSLRKLRAAYAGSAIRVVRSSDSAESDIGFLGTNLDTPALLTFVGAGTGYVKTVYDQSGNGRHFTQSGLAAFMPQIVQSGTLVTVNSKPAMIYDGTAGKGVTLNAGSNIDFKDSVAHVLFRFAAGGGNNARILAGRNSGDANDYDANSAIFLYRPATNAQVSPYFNANQDPLTYTYSTLSQAQLVVDSGKGTVTNNLDGSVGASATSNNPQLRHFCTGDILGSGSPLTGYINEWILWNSALTSVQLTTLQTYTRSYWGTP